VRPIARGEDGIMRRFVSGLLIILSAALLLLSSTSLWTRRNVINTQVFVSNVETMIDLPQVEARINQRVTELVMTNPRVTDALDAATEALPPRLQTFRPTVESGIQSLVSAGVGRILATDPFRPVTEAALTSAHQQLVNGEAVRFTLGQAKNLVPASATDGLAGQVLDLIPDDVGVTLLSPADAPQVYTAVDLLKSAWWWTGLAGLAAFAGALAVSRRRRNTLRAWAVTTTAFGLLLLIGLRITRGALLPQVKAENRDAVGAIYDVLAGSLRAWTIWFVVIALVVLVETIVWGRLGIVSGIRRGAAAARAQVQRRSEERSAQAAAAAGADGTPAAPVAEESWPQRVAAQTRAFAQGMELDRRAASFGAFVAAHYRPARWAGIAVGTIVLLSWPAPTLSVLIWIVALVAAYIGVLEWLRSKAPAEPAAAAAAGVGGELVVPAQRETSPVGPAAGWSERTVHPEPVIPTARAGHGPAPDGVNGAAAVAVVTAAPPEPGAPAAQVLSPEAVLGMKDRLDLLVQLGAARDAGLLSDEEFGREKSRLLTV
jgi:hypothetical protein